MGHIIAKFQHLASESIRFFHIYSFFHQNNSLVEKFEYFNIHE